MKKRGMRPFDEIEIQTNPNSQLELYSWFEAIKQQVVPMSYFVVIK